MSNNRTTNSIANLSEAIGIIILLLFFYANCYPLFHSWGMTAPVVNQIIVATIRTGLFDDERNGKLLSLVFILFGIVASPKRKEPGISWRICFAELGIGFIIYLLTPFFWDPEDSSRTPYVVYIVFTSLNMLWIMYSASRFVRYIPRPWAGNDPFGREEAGFPQSTHRVRTLFALHLRTLFNYKGRRQKGWLSLINPRRGVLIIGSPGSGKSYFIIEPMIRQLIAKRASMMIYDFKFDALTKIAFQYFLANRRLYPCRSGFYCINFTKPDRSHRCNVLAPETLHWPADALGISRTILLSLNKSWVERQGDFFIESPIVFLAALIWFLRNYRNGIYCTLPHVVELAKLSYDKLFTVLSTERSIDSLIDPFLRAYTNETTEMLDGQIAGAKIPLARLSSPDIYYVLTGNDVNLHINDPKAPAILCLGGDPNRSEALAPVLSLFIDRINQLCNTPGQHPCAIVCDEFATVRAPAVLRTVATGRSNDMMPVLAVQDMSQLHILYSRGEADSILGICGNLICGQVGGQTAKLVSQNFPRILKEKQSVSVNSDDTSVSRHLQWEDTVSPSTIAGLSSGEFVGLLADDPSAQMPLKTFHARIVRDKKDTAAGVDLPIVHSVTEKDLQDAYNQVQLDIEKMVADVTSNITDQL
jgi:hypothetical protein